MKVVEQFTKLHRYLYFLEVLKIEGRDAILKLAKGRGGIGICPYITVEKLEQKKTTIFGSSSFEDDDEQNYNQNNQSKAPFLHLKI